MPCDRKIGPYDCCSVVQGDCLELMKALPDGCMDAVITDPPYGILADSGSAATRRSNGNNGDGKMLWDVAPLTESLSVLHSKAAIRMIWGGCHLSLPETFGYLIWDKQIDGLNFGEVEFCWTNMRFAPRIFRYRAVGVDGGKEHPTQKPLALMRWCIEQAGMPETILDPYCGSGTTLVAAKKLGRHFLGFEISEEYCKIARDRIARVEAQPTLFEPKPEQLNFLDTAKDLK